MIIVSAREMVAEVDHPACGPMKLVNTPVKFSHSKPSIRSPPPTLGQHTEEILTDLLGMDHDTIQDLKQEGVIG
jgi:succinate---hydroxymethylglutarate CoA-transferase